MAAPSVTRPSSKSGKRKRPDNPRTAIENSSNATTPSDADPYDIMSFDGWAAPKDKAPIARRSDSVMREAPKKRAPAARKEDTGAGKATRARTPSQPLPSEKPPSSRKDTGSRPTAGARRGVQSSLQIRKKQPRSEAIAAAPASHDKVPSRRSAPPDPEDDRSHNPSKRPRPASRGKVPTKRSTPPDSEDDRSHKPSKRPRSRRLIDALVDQATESSDEEASDDETPRTAQPEPASRRENREMSEGPSPRAGRIVKPPASVKVTYGAQRSILKAAGSDDLLGDRSLLQPLTAPLPSAPSGLDFSLPQGERDDDEATNKGAVRSIHELRQAGANDRFADEIDDLLERVGTPRKESTSLRRNALLEMAAKLHQKRFLRQFRDYGSHGALFDELGKEDDIVSGFALVSALLTLLAANAAPRASKYLQSGISRLLRKLLRHGDDISSIAAQRSTNVSRNTRTTIASLKSAVLKLDVWEKGLSSLTPRSLSLKFISVAFGSADGHLCIRAFEGLADSLFSILRLAAKPAFLEDCSEVERADCSVVATVLQKLSVGAVAGEWTSVYPEIISATLDAALQRRARLPGTFEQALLKLAMNCTNNNPDAASVWHHTGRLGSIAASTCSCFNLVKDGLAGDEWDAEEHNRLLLILGLMINLCEHAPSSEFALDTDILDNLIRVYLGSYSSTQEVCYVPKRLMICAHG
ncbi:hypothetical protein IMZ48_03555 [Candidatus Bathyarchaeota archaeon]|nr:hypothetical protein [Candidatus Bathyarchaeota archaeon]